METEEIFTFIRKKASLRARELTPKLRVLVALAEDKGSFTSTHMVLSSRGSNNFSDLHWQTHGVHTCIQGDKTFIHRKIK